MQQPDIAEVLAGREWTGAGLEELLAFPRQRTLAFASGSRFPGDLSVLARLRSLHTVAFDSSELSRENMAALGRLPSVARLDLKNCRFSPQALAALCQSVAEGGAPRLSELWLEGASVDDGSLREVGRLKGVRWLILSRTPISDAGLQHLRELPRLETLWLNHTRVTDEGLLQLDGLPNLSIVAVGGSMASEAGTRALFAAQVARRKSKRPIDEAARREAQHALWRFLREMHDWEAAAYARSREIEARHRSARPQPNVLAPEESRESDEFWRDINAQKSEIAGRLCSPALLGRGAGSAGSYGNPPRFDPDGKTIVDVEAPSPGKVIFYTDHPGAGGRRRRWTVRKIEGRWKVDEVQWWCGGWKREHV